MFQVPEQNIPTASTYVPPLPMIFGKSEPLDDSLSDLSRKRPEPPSPLENGADEPEKGEEEKVAKKQRRLIKNREAAAQFRHRQKAYMHKLEKHAADLTTSNLQVAAKIDLLTSENKLMKEQLNYLRNFMKNAVSLSFPGAPVPPALPPDSTPADLNPTSLTATTPASTTPNPVSPPPPMTELFPNLNLADVDSAGNINMSASPLPVLTSTSPINIFPLTNNLTANPAATTAPPPATLDPSLFSFQSPSTFADNPLSSAPLEFTSTSNSLSGNLTPSPQLSHSTMLNSILNSIMAPELDPAKPK